MMQQVTLERLRQADGSGTMKTGNYGRIGCENTNRAPPV